ncbi:NAD(P) transhydrogenase alpha subunit [Arthrobacter sp. 9V]|uniref:NAD(P) transhydrogenase subunit alpha n=1 Tax=Arthrobacter sp. 9V TaxID=2653132 RepID=UPI0012F41E06|nr:NAD(P) transhydrogenase subunit alpha [Arthrobacter sp. 9V]VXA96158.1 NAD(P) transhydrogenase alpha subunit [Arthrobacter sp. 9V]
MDGMSLLTITVLAVFVGFEVVSKVSSTLHTPLMSGANAIHGIILVGAIIVAGQAADPWVLAVALLAVVLATANLVGGFVVTDRMLEMFRGRQRPPSNAGEGGGARESGSAREVKGSGVAGDPGVLGGTGAAGIRKGRPQ